MRFDGRFTANFDWETLVLTGAITTLSLLLLYSAASTSSVVNLQGIYLKQLTWLGVSAVVMAVALVFDYQTLSRYAYVFYGVMIVSLVAVLLFGRVVNGAQRWLVIGAWRIQVSELMKPALILVLARYFALDKHQDNEALSFRDLLIPFAMVCVPFLLIAKQPDLSTSMVLVAILCVMVLVTGLQRKTMLILGLGGVGVLPAMWFFLKEYQRERLLTLFNPESDLLGAGYHSWQSKIAIGSGGLWGKGLFAGTQSRLNFLPEKHTDFIFAVLGEEMGFVGVLLLLGLFSLLLMHGLTIAARARDRLGALLATGVVTLLAVQLFLNIGMTIGLIPIVGLPLPLMSYGGSSLLTTFFCLGLLMNVRLHRFTF